MKHGTRVSGSASEAGNGRPGPKYYVYRGTKHDVTERVRTAIGAASAAGLEAIHAAARERRARYFALLDKNTGRSAAAAAVGISPKTAAKYERERKAAALAGGGT